MMLSCREVTQLVSESLDRHLPFHKWMSMRIHLLMCGFCSRYRKQLRALRDAVALHCKQGTDMEGYSGCLSKEARERIKQSLNAESNKSD